MRLLRRCWGRLGISGICSFARAGGSYHGWKHRPLDGRALDACAYTRLMRRLRPGRGRVLLAFATLARAQSRYDMYGDPVDVSVQSLADNPRVVRRPGRAREGQVRAGDEHRPARLPAAGRLHGPASSSSRCRRSRALRGRGPASTLAARSRSPGSSRRTATSPPTPEMGVVAGDIMFWECIGPPEEVKGDIKANLVSLENLVGGPGPLRREDHPRLRPLPGQEPLRRPALAQPAAVARLGDEGRRVRDLGHRPQAQRVRLRARRQHEAGHREVDPGRGRAGDDQGGDLPRAMQVDPGQAGRGGGLGAVGRAPAATPGRPSPPRRPRRSRPWWCSRCPSTARPRSRRTAASRSSSAGTWTRAASRAACCIRYAPPSRPGRPRLRRGEDDLRRRPAGPDRGPGRRAAAGARRGDPAPARHHRHRGSGARGPARRARADRSGATDMLRYAGRHASLLGAR